MKVGIITQPLYINYGGILQNFALQQALKKMGHTPITLDYMPSLSFSRYLLYAGKSILCSLIPSKRHPIKRYKHYLERPENIDSFVRSQINLTRTIPAYTKKVLRKYGIEALIVGSDQVWRYAYGSHYIEDMYLEFAQNHPCMKVAYGASFGVNHWDYPADKTLKVKQLVKQFKAISVREQSGISMCRKHLGVDAINVLDPTLLLTAADYEVFCKKSAPEQPPYLASYVLDMTEDKAAHIQTLARDKKLTIKEMTVSDNGLSIEDWLTTIQNAAFVITDSYHGTLFSILFEKQFQTLINQERGGDRFITVFENLRIGPNERRNYSAIRANLNMLRSESLSFLFNSLK